MPPVAASQSRARSTQQQLLRAAEKLFARDGLVNVSVRSIVIEAGQRNESALHYHFGNRDGLIAALHAERSAEIQAERRRVRENLINHSNSLSVKNLAVTMVRPAFELARRDPGFRNYLNVFAPLLLFSSRSLSALLSRHEDVGSEDLRHGLQEILPGQSAELREIRFESAARYAALSMSRHAQEKHAFTGSSADLFFSNLIDTLVAILTTEPSPETLALMAEIEDAPETGRL